MTAKIKPLQPGDKVKVAETVKGLRGMEGTINRKSDNPNYDWVVTFGYDSVATCSFKSEELTHVR